MLFDYICNIVVFNNSVEMIFQKKIIINRLFGIIMLFVSMFTTAELKKKNDKKNVLPFLDNKTYKFLVISVIFVDFKRKYHLKKLNNYKILLLI